MSWGPCEECLGYIVEPRSQHTIQPGPGSLEGVLVGSVSTSGGGKHAGKVLLAVLVLGALLVVAWSRRVPTQPLTPAERAAFERSHGQLCQPALGVALADPGEGFVADENASKMYSEAIRQQGAEGLAFWLFKEAGNGQMVSVQVAKGLGGDAENFTSFMTGIKRGVVNNGFNVESESSEVEAKPYRYHLAAGRSGRAMDFDCTTAKSEEPFPLILCVQTVAADHEVLRAVRESAAFGSCR